MSQVTSEGSTAMATKPPSPQDLDDRLASLANAMAEAEQAVDDLSLPAASGDADAVAKLAKAQAKLVSLTRDRDILVRARAMAAQNIDREAVEKAAADREAAQARAKGCAKQLLDLARRIDAIADEYRRIVTEEIPNIETELWQSLRDAESALNDGVIGRKGLVRFAIEAVKTAPNVPAFRSKPCANIAGVAWNALLDNEDI